MQCLDPIPALWYHPDYKGFRFHQKPLLMGNDILRFNKMVANDDGSCPEDGLIPFYLPCGKCKLCALEKRREWITRASLELRYHKASAFISLSVNEDFMEKIFPNRSLTYAPFQLFMKRLRKWCSTHGCPSPRYVMCGEYGTMSRRPHYHAILYGFLPSDMYLWYFSKKGYAVCRSPLLESFWSDPESKEFYGYCTVSLANDACIKYLVGYVMKKLDEVTPYGFIPPFLHCSARLGLDFMRDFGFDLYASDRSGFPNCYLPDYGRLPRYFDKKAISAYNVDSVSLANSRRAKARELGFPSLSDLQRKSEFLEYITKASHNVGETNV